MRPSTLRHPARVAGASLLRLQSDERLAALAVAGHEAAFDAVVDRYRTPLTRYCAGIVGPGRAEDAVQQALINAHDALKRTDEVRHLRSWLYRIAHNAALNVLRTVRDDVSLDAPGAAAAMAEDGPAASFERSERFAAMVAALQELPERQRAALVLRELEGRSHEEIADALGVTPSAARQHIMRGRTAIRGAVTAITPYPLVVRLAELMSSPAAGGWADAAVGAGASATLAKLTAGVVATGALVGGAVGTERVVRHHEGGGGVAAAVERAPAQAVRSAATSPVVRGATVGLLPGASAGASAPRAVSGGRGGAPGPGGSGARGPGGGKDGAGEGKDPADRGPTGARGTGPGASGTGAGDDPGPGPGDDGKAKGKSGSGDGPGTSDGSGAKNPGKGDGKDVGSSGKDSNNAKDPDKGKDSDKGKSGSSGKPTATDDNGSTSHGGRAESDATTPAPTPTAPAPAPATITTPTTTTPSTSKGSGQDNSGDNESDSSSDDED